MSTATETPTFTPGAIDLLLIEEGLDDLLRCDARRNHSCHRPAAWMCVCPRCGKTTPYCQRCRRALEQIVTLLGGDADATHDGNGGCGHTFPLSEIVWRPV